MIWLTLLVICWPIILFFIKIQGEKFFKLHLKFEELYNDLFIKIDEIAERVLTLGDSPEHKLIEYLKISKRK